MGKIVDDQRDGGAFGEEDDAMSDRFDLCFIGVFCADLEDVDSPFDQSGGDAFGIDDGGDAEVENSVESRLRKVLH